MSVPTCVSPEKSQDQKVENRAASMYERCEGGTWESNPPSQGPIPPETVPYYFEDISRETADLVLWDRGCVDGMYLLRKSTNKDADYVLSLCYKNSVLHYRLKTYVDGLIGLAGMPKQKFVGPVELINNVEGVACKPRIPCCRVTSQLIGDLYFGLSRDEVRKIMKQKAQEWGIQEDKLDSEQNENYGDLKSLMLKTVHEYQPWFHGLLNREDAEKRLDMYGHSDGKFLVRERDVSSYALCVSVNNAAKHYKIDVLPSGEFSMQTGQKFPNLLALVRHYMVCSDGLKVSLKQPCSKPDGAQNSCEVSSSDSDLQHLSSHFSSGENSPLHVPKKSAVFPETCASSKNSNDYDRFNQTRKISLPETPHHHKSIEKSHRRLSSPPGTIQVEDLVSPMSFRKSNESHLDSKPPPVPAPRLSLGTRSRSVDEDLKLESSSSDANSCSDKQRFGSSGIESPGPHSESSFGGFLHKLIGRVHKSLVSQNESDSGPADAVKSTNDGSCAKKVQVSGHGNEDLLKKERPLPLPRKRIIGASKATGNAKHEESLPKLSLIRENPALASNGSQNLEKSESNEAANCEAECSEPPPPHLDSVQEDSSRSEIPLNEPLYVEIDPTLEEESNDIQSGVSWETNNEYEAMSLPQKKECSIARSASAPGQQPSVKHTLDENKAVGGTKPKVVTDSEAKVSRSKSISPCSKNISSEFGDTGWDDEPRTPPPIPMVVKLKRRWSKEKSESIYRTIRHHRKNYINLDRKAIKLEEKIGSGNFGDVMRATYSSSNGDMDLAIKTLKPNSIAKQKYEILKEARMMAKFDHCHIVRLIGVCEGDPFMLVMELAPLGPLNKYLKRHREIPINDIVMLIEQVAMAMEYLENQQYVHRDLAARNVLLVNDKFAKISDFGMSRALGIDRDYYRAAESGKWPLKWYAPECIYYFKFSSRSDVWSFGVTLWEALSYGDRPYQGMVGKEILEMFYRNERLPQPKGCSDALYKIMLNCWQMKPEDRPSFSELRQVLHNFTTS